MQDIRLVFERALANDARVVMIYEGSSGYTERKVRVISIEENGVTAYCYLRRQRRKFLFENILSAQIADT